MSVIAHLRIDADSFELGRILEMGQNTSIELMSMVPLGERAVPLFTVHDDTREDFEETVRNHPSVDELRVMSEHDGETVYALDWAVERDVFFQGMEETNAHLLESRGTGTTWEFELRFPDHAALSDFQEHCLNAHIQLEVGRIYNPSRPGSGPWYGLSPVQRDTLVKAVEGGYYAIPRRKSTKDLADELEISDQAVTERLRRAISRLVENTLIASMEADVYERVG